MRLRVSEEREFPSRKDICKLPKLEPGASVDKTVPWIPFHMEDLQESSCQDSGQMLGRDSMNKSAADARKRLQQIISTNLIEGAPRLLFVMIMLGKQV